MTNEEQKLIQQLDWLREAHIELEYLTSFHDYTEEEQSRLDETVALWHKVLFLVERDLDNSLIMQPSSNQIQ